MNNKARQNWHFFHLGRLLRRAVALTLTLTMLLPTVAFGFDAMGKPTVVTDSKEFPTITVEANAVVDRWFDPAGPESAADYLTGYLEVAIRVKSGERGGTVQAFNTLSLALHYSSLLTPYDWTVQKGWSETEPAKDSDGKEIVNPVDLTGKGVSFANADMTTMQTLKNNQLTTAVGHVSGKDDKGGFLYIMANADRPVTLEDDTVLAVVRFKYDLLDDTHPTGILPVAKDGVQQWVDPASDNCLIRLATPTELGTNYIQPEVYYDSADNGMFYSADPDRYREAVAADGVTTSRTSNLIPLNTVYDGVIKPNNINFTLVNKTTYNDGGLSLDDLASVLFYDWDDTLIGVLIVPRDGDARKLVNDYVRENLVHPDLRTAAVDSLARKDNYRGKYPSTPMVETGTDATMDSKRTDGLVGSDYPLTNKLDYVFIQRPMEKVTEDKDGNPIKTNTWRQKGTSETDLTTEEWDENYPFVYGWARLTDDNWNNPGSMWTTIGVGELETYTGLAAGAYPEDLKTGVIAANQNGAELTVTDKDFRFESFDFRDHPLAPGGVCSVKAVYEPGDNLLNGGYSYQMISEPYYNKMNDPSAEFGGAYSVDVVYERTNISVAQKYAGIVRARQLELRQETTTDLRWDNEYLSNASIADQKDRTKTTYSTVPVDNVDEVNIQLILSGRYNKVDYYLVEANNASFVTGGTRSDTNITRKNTAHLVDNYNYNTADNDTSHDYYRAEYVDTDSDGKVNDDRSGTYGFVLFGTINNLAQKALEHKDGNLTDLMFGNFLSLDNFNDMNLQVRGVFEDGKWVGAAPVAFEDWETVQAGWEAAVVAARTAHEKIPADNTWWNVEQDLPQFTYHQIQLYINDYVNNGSATLLDADAADKQTITWCNLHEECASSRTGKPNSLSKMVKAALAGERDKLMLLTMDEAESMSHFRSNERGTAFATIGQLADALISAAQGVNGIRTLDPDVLTPNSDGSKSPAYWAAWDSIQGYILANPKPTTTAGLDAAIKNSRDTAWWNEGESAPSSGSLADLVAAEEKAVETGRDAWINYYRYRDAFTDMKTNGVSPQAQWTRITENLVKNIDGEPFDTYDAFKAAFRSAVAAVGPYDPDDKDYWNKLQYIMAGDTRTPEADQYPKYWWHNGYSRITDLASLLTAAQEYLKGNTAVWDMFTALEEDGGLYGKDMTQLHFRQGFNGTTDKYTDIDDFKKAVLEFIKEDGAQIATGSSTVTQRNNSWNQLQYYLIHKDDPGGIDLTQRETNLAIQAEAPYYWWKDAGEGTVYPLTPGVGDSNIQELDEAIYRAAFNGNPKALDQLTATAISAFRLIPSYAGSEKDWDALTKYDVTMLNQMKSDLEALAKAAGKTDCRTLNWRQIQHYLLGGGYLAATDPSLPTDTATDKDNATTGVKNYWWKLGNVNPNLATEPIDTDLDAFLKIIDEVAAGTYTGNFYTEIELYVGYTEGSGSRLNLYGGWTFFPQPIEFEYGSVANLQMKLDNIAMQLNTDGASAEDVLDWFVLQYYAFEDNDYWGGPIVSKAEAKRFYLDLLTNMGMESWAPSYVDITPASFVLMANEMLTPAEQIESLTEQITQLTEAIRETPEFAAEYAQEIARLMAALEELKALLEGTGEPACTCGSEDGTHAEDCPLYVAPEEPACTCGSEDGTHAEDCPLYVAPEEPVCTCGSEDGIHAEDCPLYVVPETPACTCGSEGGTHAEDCPLYVAPEEPAEPEEPTCTCGSEDGTHNQDCPLYVAPETPVCTCGSEDGTHTEGCPLYVAPDDVGADVPIGPECTCGSEDGTHSSDCPLYVAPELPDEELTDPEVPGGETPAPEPEPEPEPDPAPAPDPEPETTETDTSDPEPSGELSARRSKRLSLRLIALTNRFFDSGGWNMNGITTQKNISPPGQWMARAPWLWTMTERRGLA